ncbi:uncharacterized mitochondrial protein AtMg00820-like [Hibiscus syriacus]|uniref:uncharacterized mitochondrial protein AtMg00820-like n=1 Tax=Hibiscus syriacus TaxID=106335 RepID=UPI001924A867|nr:uncharacterized mitochondrial protein AtMg00820-like [Hibiscus syriacus]
MVTKSKVGTFKSKVFSTVVKDDESVDVFEALQYPSWKPLPIDCKLLRCKWLFKIKMKHDGMIDRLKARLVAKGYSQKGGIDFKETFSPVVCAAQFVQFLLLMF